MMKTIDALDVEVFDVEIAPRMTELSLLKLKSYPPSRLLYPELRHWPNHEIDDTRKSLRHDEVG